MIRPPPRSTLPPYPTPFRSLGLHDPADAAQERPEPRRALVVGRQAERQVVGVAGVPPAELLRQPRQAPVEPQAQGVGEDRKSTRLNSSHLVISYAVFCLKKT